jgi:hypothetical protein
MKLLCLVCTLELHFDSDKSLWETTPDVDIMAQFLAKQRLLPWSVDAANTSSPCL